MAEVLAHAQSRAQGSQPKWQSDGNLQQEISLQPQQTTAAPVDLPRCRFCTFVGLNIGSLNKHIGKMHKDQLNAEPKRDTSTERVEHDADLSTGERLRVMAQLRRSKPLVKRIPQGARFAASKKFSTVLAQVVTKNDTGGWWNLLSFGYRTLHVATGLHPNKSAATVIRQNIAVFDSWTLPSEHTARPSKATPRSQDDVLNRRARAAESKLLLDHDVRGAARILCSDECIAEISSDSLQEMIDKHPKARAEDRIVSDPPDLQLTICTPEATEKAVLAMPSKASGGLDGLTPPHLRDLL